MARIIIILLLLAGSAFGASWSFTITDNTTTIDDAYLRANASTTNYGTENYLVLGGNSSDYNVLIRFNTLSDSLALEDYAGTVDSIKITLISGGIISGSDTIIARPFTVRQSWAEGNGTDGVTWACRNYIESSCFQTWGTNGCLSTSTDIFDDEQDSVILTSGNTGWPTTHTLSLNVTNFGSTYESILINQTYTNDATAITYWFASDIAGNYGPELEVWGHSEEEASGPVDYSHGPGGNRQAHGSGGNSGAHK